ncbi:MAG: hypothetical protein IT258_02760 [Saprospiraceae bacterium]|nr:hypothetical protein [Saprospiraceae bacterium]
MKFNQFVLFTLSCIFCTSANAQSFKKGLVYLQNGDTLSGYIADGSYESLSRSIHFKLDKKSEAENVYKPNEIKGFQFADGDYFKSELTQYTVNKKHIGMFNISEYRLLHRLNINDKTKLYELNDTWANPLFLQKEDGPLKLLCLDLNGNPNYLEELAAALNDCESIVVPATLPLEAKAIQALLLVYDHCGQKEATTPLPQIMAWAGVSIPAMSLINQYKGLGKSIQLEFRPISTGFFSNFNIGAEFLHLNATRQYERGDRSYKKIVNHRELSLKASYFMNALHGHLRPYGFLEITSYNSQFNDYYKPSNGLNYVQLNSKEEINRSALRPGIGVHGQWKRHIFRFELPIDRFAQPRIGYGYAF